MGELKKRLFIGIPLPEDLASELTLSLGLFASYGRVIPPENLHITLAFLGTVEETHLKDIIIRADRVFQTYCSFSLKVGEITHFPKDSPRMVWLVFKEHALFSNLVKDLYHALSDFGSKKVQKGQIIPHVTLVRLKTSIPNLSDLKYRTQNMNISHANLYESRLMPDGAVYTKLVSFSLKKCPQVS